MSKLEQDVTILARTHGKIDFEHADAHWGVIVNGNLPFLFREEELSGLAAAEFRDRMGWSLPGTIIEPSPATDFYRELRIPLHDYFEPDRARDTATSFFPNALSDAPKYDPQQTERNLMGTFRHERILRFHLGEALRQRGENRNVVESPEGFYSYVGYLCDPLTPQRIRSVSTDSVTEFYILAMQKCAAIEDGLVRTVAHDAAALELCKQISVVRPQYTDLIQGRVEQLRQSTDQLAELQRSRVASGMQPV